MCVKSFKQKFSKTDNVAYIRFGFNFQWMKASFSSDNNLPVPERGVITIYHTVDLILHDEIQNSEIS